MMRNTLQLTRPADTVPVLLSPPGPVARSCARRGFIHLDDRSRRVIMCAHVPEQFNPDGGAQHG